MTRIKDCTQILNGVGVNPDLQGNSNGHIPFFRNSDFSKRGNSLFLEVSDSNFSTEEIVLNKLRTIPANSLVFSKIGESIRKNHKKFTKQLSVIDNNLAAFKISATQDNRFFYWFLKAIDFGNYLLPSTIPVLDLDQLKLISIPDLPLPEQTAIAAYLDEKTAKIDNRITTLTSMIDKLEELKQSVIFEAVTRGIDSNVRMKDSGVEWIGMIPEDWEVKRVKDVCISLGGGNYGEDETSIGLSVPCVSISDFKNGDLSNTEQVKMTRIYRHSNVLKKGVILIEKSGGGEKVPVGRIIYVLNDVEAYYTNFVQGLKVVSINSKFVSYFLKMVHKNKLHMDFVKQTTGLQNFEFNKFSNYFQIPLPPPAIAATIVSYLDTETKKIDFKIENIKKQIELLKEYKQAVIFEAVTGK